MTLQVIEAVAVEQGPAEAFDPELAEKPNFLGGLYNLVVWQPKNAEHEYFRRHTARVGQMAPDFTLPSLEGGEVTLSSLRGKPVAIEFGSIT